MKLFSAIAGKADDLKHDFLSSLVVFLVAVPLCLGIAIACDVPPALGLISGIVGGIVVGSLGGCRLQVTGPAAGLTVLVVEIVHRHGLATLGMILLAAGALQIAAGLLRIGRWFRAVSPAVVHGMLGAIGVILIVGQFHVMLDYKPQGHALHNLLTIPQAVSNAVSATDGWSHLHAGGLGLFTLMVLFGWKYLGLEKKLHIPGAFPAILLAAVLAGLFHLQVAFINIPDSLCGSVTLPTADVWTVLLDGTVLLTAVSLAFVASTETLLSATAVDQMHRGKTTNYDRELIGQGIGNMLCGLLGALPVTGVIARSSVNVENGARTRVSSILHGIWLLTFVVLLPAVLRLIPITSLAALLIFTGMKLLDLSVLKRLLQFSRAEAAIYLATLSLVVATDLITGVVSGLLLAVVKLLWVMSRLDVSVKAGADERSVTLHLAGAATFLGLPKLTNVLETIAAGTIVMLEFSGLRHIDHASIEVLRNWGKRQESQGGQLVADWTRLMEKYQAG